MPVRRGRGIISSRGRDEHEELGFNVQNAFKLRFRLTSSLLFPANLF